MLSKSRYMRGLKCMRSLWLYVHNKDEQIITEAMQVIFTRGINVGELAQQYFPNGYMAVKGDFPTKESAEYTKELIDSGIETIYEATFVYDNTLVAVDILQKIDDKWYLYEVKSTNSVKPEHIKDVAVQYYVLTGCGISVADVNIMHFNKQYVRRGELNIRELFLPESVLDGVVKYQKKIKQNITLFLQMLEGEEPQIEMGKQCTKPYQCDFIDYCKKLQVPVGKVQPLSNEAQIDTSSIRAFTNSIVYPIAHLDFETIMPGVPLFDESRPYQQLPFQYSLHIQFEKNGTLAHKSFLADSDLQIDPRKELITQLIEDTLGIETIFVYYIPFEKRRIYEMMRDFPEYEHQLRKIYYSLVDLIIPFKKGYYRTETMGTSSSIKTVLPIICPELRYDEMSISDGMQASNTFLDLYYCKEPEVIIQRRNELLEYCHLDTWGMVHILSLLQKI